MNIFASLEAGGYEEVAVLHNAQTGLCAFLAIHDTTRGPTTRPETPLTTKQASRWAIGVCVRCRSESRLWSITHRGPR